MYSHMLANMAATSALHLLVCACSHLLGLACKARGSQEVIATRPMLSQACATTQTHWFLIGACSERFELSLGAFLGIHGSDRYIGKWVSTNWPRWVSFLTQVQCSFGDGMIISQHAYRDQLRRAKQALVPRDLDFDEFSTSLACLLALLARWASTLRDESRPRARTILQALLACGLPSASLYWWVATQSTDMTSWPTTSQSQGARLEVASGGDGMQSWRGVVVPELLAAVGSRLATSLRRSPGSMNP